MAGTQIYENILHKSADHSFIHSFDFADRPVFEIKIKTQRSGYKIIPRPLEKHYANEPLSSPRYETQL